MGTTASTTALTTTTTAAQGDRAEAGLADYAAHLGGQDGTKTNLRLRDDR